MDGHVRVHAERRHDAARMMRRIRAVVRFPARRREKFYGKDERRARRPVGKGKGTGSSALSASYVILAGCDYKPPRFRRRRNSTTGNHATDPFFAAFAGSRRPSATQTLLFAERSFSRQTLPRRAIAQHVSVAPPGCLLAGKSVRIAGILPAHNRLLRLQRIFLLFASSSSLYQALRKFSK